MAYPQELNVTGAGSSEVNGSYSLDETVNQMPSWVSDSGVILSCKGTYWTLEDNDTVYYKSTPGFDTVWVAEEGQQPLPTINQI
jgi:hypothetical protein